MAPFLESRGTALDAGAQRHGAFNIGERIELIHRATDRDIFARGALHVASRLPGRAAGRYRVADLL